MRADELTSGKRNPDGHISYRKLRAPAGHAGTLVIPEDGRSLLDANRDLLGQLPLKFFPGDFRAQARKELIQLASDYSRRYRDVGEVDTQSPVIMAGHQPALFHPGVWFKNFLLSELAQDLNCAAINLVVDNDVASSASIRVPVDRSQPAFGTVPIDDPAPQVPFEARCIQNLSAFKSFSTRVSQAIAPFVPDPVVDKLWRYTLSSIDSNNRLGHSLAAGRHRLEQDYGVETLEIPVSQIVQTVAFAKFAYMIVAAAPQFLDIYNSALKEYRQVHRIRSRSHPAPDLEVVEGRVELPFWIWSEEHPMRRRLFCRNHGQQVELCDLNGFSKTVEADSFVEQMASLAASGVAVRPRALTLTMYSRLVLCDLFIHGIGGSKYDQLTDSIAERFFGIEQPGYMTVTATMKLPSGVQLKEPVKVSEVDRALRELKFHPEVEIGTAEDDKTAAAIAGKKQWIAKELPRGHRLERHKAITGFNEALQPVVEPRRRQLLDERQQLTESAASAKVLGSREFSFALHPASLPEELKALAKRSLIGHE